MADSATKRPLAVHLYGPGSEPAAGVPVRALAGANARLALGDCTALHVALPDRSLTEQRYVVDKVLRQVLGLVEAADVSLQTDGVADDATVAVALDLRKRCGGVTVVGRDDLKARIEQVGDLEDGYRAWVDEDPSLRTSHAIASDVSAWAGSRDDVDCEVLDETALAEHGCRLLLAVGSGSEASPSRLVLARYRPEAPSPRMIVGKGVTFDSGGINVKPYEAFVPMMKNDMAGAALAFHLFKGLVEAGHDEPLALAIPTCENAVDGKSMRPGALIESHRGHVVRVDHTDAEGRLILADALSLAGDRYQPSEILCFATLTTAALIAYGPYATPVHFAGPELERKLAEAAAATGEDLHFFPERIWHTEANRDEEADLKNTGRLPGNASRGAGSRNAAHFLKQFTDHPLVHFDIFASTWNWAGDAPGSGSGATGAPLRTLLAAFGVGR